jgi:transposase-like protein
MVMNPSKRKNWSAEEKFFFIKLLTIPQKSEKPKTVQEVVNDYPIAAKTLYEWLKLYQSKGNDAFSKNNRKLSTSKSNNPELQSEIFKIALLNPIFNGKEIIQNLSPVHRRITLPTVQKILKIRGLNSRQKRLIATQYEYVKNHLAISKSTLDYLIKKNPYLDLLQINNQIEGCLFYLKCLDLSNLYSVDAGYLLLAVDTKSLTTFSQVWNGKYLDIPIKFINDVSNIFGKYGKESHFETEDSDIFRDLKNSHATHQINWFDSTKYYFSQDRLEVAISELLKIIQIDFLKSYIFTTVEKLQTDLGEFLLMLRATDGPLGYPTFGQSPHHLNKHNN